MTSCVVCHDPLVAHVEPDNDTNESYGAAGSSASAQAHTTTVPDELIPACGCQFHWFVRECVHSHINSIDHCLRECFFDAFTSTQCPNCAHELSVPTQQSGAADAQILCTVNNEGGQQTGVDLLPRLREEHHLRQHPEQRKGMAFLGLCEEGDVPDIIELLYGDEADDDDDTPSMSADQILRFQNPLGDSSSGLHVAVKSGSREVAWMLLLLASTLPEMDFPALVYQEAGHLGVMRKEQSGLVDIRTLRDSQGRTAADLANSSGVVWTGWQQRLTAP